jgi:hypothetical protein
MNQIVAIYAKITIVNGILYPDQNWSHTIDIINTICTFIRISYYSLLILPHLFFNILYRSELIDLLKITNKSLNRLVRF